MHGCVYRMDAYLHACTWAKMLQRTRPGVLVFTHAMRHGLSYHKGHRRNLCSFLQHSQSVMVGGGGGGKEDGNGDDYTMID